MNEMMKFDDEDAPLYTRAWPTLDVGTGKYYAQISVKRKNVKVHRLIMNAPVGMDVDHINGDTLDNRKVNLRVVTRAMNMANRVRLNSNNTTGYRGVQRNPGSKRNPFIIRVMVNGRNHYLGSYKDALFAAAMACTWREINMPGAKRG